MLGIRNGDFTRHSSMKNHQWGGVWGIIRNMQWRLYWEKGNKGGGIFVIGDDIYCKYHVLSESEIIGSGIITLSDCFFYVEKELTTSFLRHTISVNFIVTINYLSTTQTVVCLLVNHASYVICHYFVLQTHN